MMTPSRIFTFVAQQNGVPSPVVTEAPTRPAKPHLELLGRSGVEDITWLARRCAIRASIQELLDTANDAILKCDCRIWRDQRNALRSHLSRFLRPSRSDDDPTMLIVHTAVISEIATREMFLSGTVRPASELCQCHYPIGERVAMQYSPLPRGSIGIDGMGFYWKLPAGHCTDDLYFARLSQHFFDVRPNGIGSGYMRQQLGLSRESYEMSRFLAAGVHPTQAELLRAFIRTPDGMRHDHVTITENGPAVVVPQGSLGKDECAQPSGLIDAYILKVWKIRQSPDCCSGQVTFDELGFCIDPFTGRLIYIVTLRDTLDMVSGRPEETLWGRCITERG